MLSKSFVRQNTYQNYINKNVKNKSIVYNKIQNNKNTKLYINNYIYNNRLFISSSYDDMNENDNMHDSNDEYDDDNELEDEFRELTALRQYQQKDINNTTNTNKYNKIQKKNVNISSNVTKDKREMDTIFDIPETNTADLYKKEGKANPIEIPEIPQSHTIRKEDTVYDQLGFQRYEQLQAGVYEEPFFEYPDYDSSSSDIDELNKNSMRNVDDDDDTIEKLLSKSNTSNDNILQKKTKRNLFWKKFQDITSNYPYIRMHNSNTYIDANPTIRPYIIEAIPHVWNHGQLKRLILNAYKTGDIGFVDKVINDIKEYHKNKYYYSRLKFDDIKMHILRPRYLPRKEFLTWIDNNIKYCNNWDITCYNSIINYYEDLGLYKESEKYLLLAIKNNVFVDIISTIKEVKSGKGSEMAHIVAYGYHHKDYINKDIRIKLKDSNAIYINLSTCDKSTIKTAIRYSFRLLRDKKISIPKQLAIQLTLPNDRHRLSTQPGKTLYIQPWCEKLSYLKDLLQKYIPSSFTRIPKSPYVIYYTQAQTEYILRKLPYRQALQS